MCVCVCVFHLINYVLSVDDGQGAFVCLLNGVLCLIINSSSSIKQLVTAVKLMICARSFRFLLNSITLIFLIFPSC